MHSASFQQLTLLQRERESDRDREREREEERERERWIEKGMGEGKRVIGETEQERNGGTVRLKEIEKGRQTEREREREGKR